MKQINYQPKDIAGKLAKVFLYNPLTMLIGISLLIIGYISLQITPREEDPQMAVSAGVIIIGAPGQTPREVENVIIKPLERKLKEIKGIDHIYGLASDNMGMINIQYKVGENREDSNLKLYDKVYQNLDILPKGVMMPVIKPFDIDIDVPIITMSFYIKDKTKINGVQLYKRVRDIQQEINAIENVSKTLLKGERKEQFNVQVDLLKLTGYHISLGQVVTALQSLAVSLPDVKGRTRDGKLVIFGVKNAIESVEDVQNIIIANYMGSPIYLKYIANVEKSYDTNNFKSAKLTLHDVHNKEFHDYDSQITLSVAKLKNTNAVFIANDVMETVENLKKVLSDEGIGIIVTRNYGERANHAVNELVFHLLISIAIIAVLLTLVLGWRESVIVTLTVPAIFAITLFVAYMTDQTVNRITLFAYLLSLGLLVDAAIIVIENIHRHLHDPKSQGKDFDEILVEATDEIGAPTNVATLAIILTMVSMAFVGQIMGQFMLPIPQNVPVALFASLFVAYIFTPYLSRKLLKPEDNPSEELTHEGEVKDA